MLKLLLGDPNARKLKRYQPIVSDINLLEEDISPLSDDALRDRTAAFQERLATAGSLENQRPILDEILPEAAVVREAGKRVLGMRHFDVQLIGGMVLHEGQIAEMKTGEGKTWWQPCPVISTPSPAVVCTWSPSTTTSPVVMRNGWGRCIVSRPFCWLDPAGHAS